jgi:8-oxo-dGTP pyrophosphatase MutT (NUDIX family)
MIELVDLVNSSGEVVKTAVDRAKSRDYDDLFMQIVIVVISNGLDELLIHERSSSKTVDRNKVDHVCGGVLSGEKPDEAVRRETMEEVSVELDSLKLVKQGINQYGRYCYLFSATSEQQPKAELDPAEVKWAKYASLDSLNAAKEDGSLEFVDGFFEDIAIAASQN